MSQTFQNPYLSVSRVRRFERCPLSFRLHYIDQCESVPGPALQLGSLLHAVLEQLYRWVMLEEHAGRLDNELALNLYRQEWSRAGLSGIGMFHEGLDLLRRYLSDHPAADHREVLAVEQEFRLPLDGDEVLGYIDRVDLLEDQAIRVVDYKTNRAIFTREEVDTDLQLTVYAMAAWTLWPWAKEVRLEFHMLRHGIALETTRTSEQLREARHYLASVARRIDSATDFPPRLSADCRYCDHRHQCPAYRAAMKGDALPRNINLADLDAVAAERERVAGLAKLFYQRRAELDAVIKPAVEEHGELELAGRAYRLTHATQRTYPIEATLRALQDATPLGEAELREQLLAIDKGAVDRLLRKLGRSMSRAQLRLLKAQLDAICEKHFTPRLYSRERVAGGTR